LLLFKKKQQIEGLMLSFGVEMVLLLEFGEIMQNQEQIL
jgi:hypothetical protein